MFNKSLADKEVIGIFVNGFKPKMTINQVDSYIRLHFGVDLRSENGIICHCIDNPII